MNSNLLLNCYLSLLEKNYAPQFKGEHIIFRYNNSLFIEVSRNHTKKYSCFFSIPNVISTEKKNKAVISRFIEETYSEVCNPVRIRIEKDETVTIYLISSTAFSDSSDRHNHIDYFCDVLAETYDVFIEMVIRRYGEE